MRVTCNVPKFFPESKCHSKRQLQNALGLQGGDSRPERRTCDLPERPTREGRVGIREFGVIQQVERLNAELRAYTLGDRSRFG